MLFGTLLERGLTFRLTQPVRRLRSNFILGVTRMPVEIVG
jgi:hypothetical protein